MTCALPTATYSRHQDRLLQTSLMTIPQCCLLSMCVQRCLCINQCCFCLDDMNCESHARSLWPPDFKYIISLSSSSVVPGMQKRAGRSNFGVQNLISATQSCNQLGLLASADHLEVVST